MQFICSLDYLYIVIPFPVYQKYKIEYYVHIEISKFVW